MKCPDPGCGSTRVACYHQAGTYREYECMACKRQFVTHEVHDSYMQQLLHRSLRLAQLEKRQAHVP